MAEPTKIRTIIVNLDHTLLRTDKTVSAYTVDVLKRCRQSGFGIMVATARPSRAVQSFQELIGFDAMTVSNGARVICCDRRTEYGICTPSAVALPDVLCRDPSLRITLETGDRAYSNKPIEDYETVLCDDLSFIAKTEGVLKLLVHLDREEIASTVQKELPKNLYATVANRHLLQIMNRSATKWNGITTMLVLHGGTADEAIYFGDDHDDIEPIQRCGCGKRNYRSESCCGSYDR